ncbi:recombinase family protein [Virgibacillus sp. CBA3643]|uniref:recombinase family protein n=1 Tax=Virgibacillus sp. CBA3643 TaxID=2942278 RepID=UPI0035A33A43
MREKAVVYARVSTDKEEQKHSLESQREYYAEYAEKKGYELLKVYFDEGLSATSAKRKAFVEMLQDAGLNMSVKENSKILEFDSSNRKPQFEWIIVKSVSRFARNTDAKAIAGLLQEKGVYIEFENMGFTTKDRDWEFRLSLFLTFAEQESIDKSLNLKKAYQIKAEKKEYHMRNLILGYDRNKETKEYEINEKEAEIVRLLFNYYVNKRVGTTTISDMLNEQGYTTKNGKNWNSNTVIRILKNHKYKGLVILNRYTNTRITGSNKKIELPEDEWTYLPDAIPAIVSAEIFDKAQEIMNERVIKTQNHTKKGTKLIKSIFHKKIYCVKCGSDYIRETSIKNGRTEYFYGCRNRRNKYRRSKKCTSRGISHNVLVRELTKIGENISNQFSNFRLDNEKEALNNILQNLDNKIKYSDTEKDKIQQEINDKDEQIENLLQSLARGATGSVEKAMKENIEKIESEKATLEASKLDFDVIKIKNNKEEYIEKYNQILELSNKKKLTFEEVLDILKSITVFPHRKILVELESPSLIPEDELAGRLKDFVYKDDQGKSTMAVTFTY